MKNNLKKNYFVLISIMVLWIIISFFVVQPQYFRKLVSSISDLVIKEGIIVINRNNTKNKLIEKTGVTTIKIYSNGTEIGNTVKIKTGDVLKDNSDEYSIAVLGDVNKDGTVDLSDASRTYRIFKNLVTPTKVERMSADSTKDNTINISDVSRTYRIFKNLVPEEDDPTPPTPVVQYTISFDSNGGSAVSSITKNSGESIGTLPTPIRTGYTFNGWYTSASGGTQISAATKVTGNATYYAHWSINQFTIKFVNNGLIIDSYTRNLGQQIGNFPTVIKTNYTLDGWYTDQEGGTRVYTTTTVTGNATYYANWNPAQYTISFDSQGGTSCSPVTKNYGESIGDLPSPSRTGYTFGGWYTGTSGSGTKITSTTTVTRNATYYAKWIVNNYTATFDPNGGSSVSPSSITKTYNQALGTLPTTSRPGFTFNGWYTAKTGGTKINTTTVLTADVTYYAQWTENQCTLDLNGNLDGTSSGNISGFGTADVYINNNLVGSGVTDFNQTYPCSSTYIVKNIKATTGHTYKGDSLYTNTLISNRSISLPFVTNSYTVTFNSNGGSAVSSKSIKYGSTIGDLPTTTKSGFVFLGWFNAASGGTQITSSTNVTGNATYYAHWDSYNILFIGNSKTYYNHMPQLFQKMTQKTNYNAKIDMITVGARNLKNHGLDTPIVGGGAGNSDKATKPYIINRLNDKRIDYVILQDQTDASENKTLTLQGINSMKTLIKKSKSKNAKVINNVIWRKLQTNSTYNGLCSNNTKPVNTAQKNADKIAGEIRGNQTPTEIIVRSGRQLFDYECEKKLLDIPNEKYHLFREDLNHPEPGGSYLEAGLIYTAIYGKPATKTTIAVGSGWRCSNGTHYNPDTGVTTFPDHNTYTFSASSESALWDFIIKNSSSYIVK